MILSPLEFVEMLRVGTVEYVSPNEIKVVLDTDTPGSIALNTGTPRPFPRVNSYLLLPIDDGYLVGQVEWITIENAEHTKQKGKQDFGLVDLPFPMRKIKLNPLGKLSKMTGPKNEEAYFFKRGVEVFPTVGDGVFLPTHAQLKAIVESGVKHRVKIGTSPLAGNANVYIDPDRLFGRHVAILGNTGSGKSCSVAGLIRWSLEAAKRSCKQPKARFIILDPNGEYANAFADEDNGLKARVFAVNPESNEKQLHVPLWLWNGAEWSVFVQASGKTQDPLLRRALREVKAGRDELLDNKQEKKKLKLRRYLSHRLVSIKNDIENGIITDSPTRFGKKLACMEEDIENKKHEYPDYVNELNSIKDAIEKALNSTLSPRRGEDNRRSSDYYSSFSEKLVEPIIELVKDLLDKLGGITSLEGPSEDTPIPFLGVSLADHLELLAEEENVKQYVDYLVLRIRTMLGNTQMKPIFGEDKKITLGQWLANYIGDNQVDNRNITIIDLSLVPSQIIHIVIAVVARMVFEALQRYRKLSVHNQVLPTVLVMEEAHTFIKRYNEEAEYQGAAAVCCQVFERIAREGRKFGLGLVLSSQRPSELSPTVLSQCNTFLLHRITNDRDQDLVQRLIPDNFRGMLRELPVLPSQHAILLGWASELPVLVRMNDLPAEHRPHSDDPDFWNVWIGVNEITGEKVDRPVDWEKIAKDWQGLC